MGSGGVRRTLPAARGRAGRARLRRVNATARRRLERKEEILQAYWRAVHAAPQEPTLRAVAAEAGMTPGNVLYYFDSMRELQMEAVAAALEQYGARRQSILERGESATERIYAMIDAGVPDEISVRRRHLYENLGALAEHPEFKPAHRESTDRQIMLYQRLIEIGSDTGEFTPALPPAIIARTLVALEQAYDLYLLLGEHALRKESRADVRNYAELALGLTGKGLSDAG